MTEIEEIIAAGETLTVEFKKELSATNKKGICKEIAALATTKGGLLLIGVDDAGSIHGVDDPRALIGQIEGWVRAHISPVPEVDCEVVNLGGKVILVLRIGKGSSPLYAYDGKFYGRTLTSSHPLKSDEIADILRGISLEEALDSLKAGLAAANSMATIAMHATSPAIVGQGDLATQNYGQISAKLLIDVMASSEMIALRSSIAVAESMAAVAMHSVAPAIHGQGDLATMNYFQLRERLFGELAASTAFTGLQSEVAAANSAALAVRYTPAPSVDGQTELATTSYEALVDRLLRDPRIQGALTSTESGAVAAQTMAIQAITATQAIQLEVERLKRALSAVGSV